MVSSTDRQSGSQTNGRKTGASMAAMRNPSISKATPRIQKPAYAAAGGAGGGGSGSGSSTSAAYGAATPTATIPVPTGEWRNWQTRRIQVPVSERTWGFNSPLAHPRLLRRGRREARIERRFRDTGVPSARSGRGSPDRSPLGAAPTQVRPAARPVRGRSG